VEAKLVISLEMMTSIGVFTATNHSPKNKQKKSTKNKHTKKTSGNNTHTKKKEKEKPRGKKE